MGLGTQQEKFSLMLARLIIYAVSIGFKVRMGEGTIMVVNCPACKTKVSLHRRGSCHHIKLGQDIDLFKGGKYLTKTKDHLPLGIYWEKMGGAWGGRFQDGNHYSLQFGKRK